jgi:hypothetical protein
VANPSKKIPLSAPSYAEPAVVKPEPAFTFVPIHPAQMLDDPYFVGTPLSPRSTTAIVKGDIRAHGTTFLINVIRSLVATIAQHETTHKVVEEDLKRATLYLKDKLTSFKDTFPLPPSGYIENNDHYPSLEVRLAGGVHKPAKWVKQLDNYTVASLCNTDIGNSTPSIFYIYATPYHSDKPIKPLP